MPEAPATWNILAEMAALAEVKPGSQRDAHKTDMAALVVAGVAVLLARHLLEQAETTDRPTARAALALLKAAVGLVVVQAPGLVVPAAAARVVLEPNTHKLLIAPLPELAVGVQAVKAAAAGIIRLATQATAAPALPLGRPAVTALVVAEAEAEVVQAVSAVAMAAMADPAGPGPMALSS
jgi:hypothetical protein